jgi:hypothetical protein
MHASDKEFITAELLLRRRWMDGYVPAIGDTRAVSAPHRVL